MKRKAIWIAVGVCALALTLSASAFAAGPKTTLVFWQNEAGSGLADWYKEVIADINAHEDFEVKLVENPIADVIDKLTAAGVSQSGFDISWDWSGTASTLMRGKGGVYQPINGLVPDSVLKKLNQGTIVANTDEKGKLCGVDRLQ